jgi:putative chitinase
MHPNRSPAVLTERQLAAIMPRARPAAIAAWIAPLRDAMAANAIDTPSRMAGFLASVANETGQLSATTEASYFATPHARIQAIFGIAAPSPSQLTLWKSFGRARFDVEFFNWVYDDANRGPYTLGNDQPGDGYRYRGLGPGQITGKRNFRAVFRRMGLPEDSDPALLLDPAQGAMAFGHYWHAAGNNERLDRGDVEGAMRVMNSGLKDFGPHLAHYQRALAILRSEPRPAPASPAEAARQVATGKTGAAAAVAAGATGITIADAASRIGEAQLAATAAKGLLATIGLPSPWTEIALGVLSVAAIVFVACRYGRKLLRGEAAST